MARILIIGGDEAPVSALVGSLEKDGHVVRAVAKADRRALEHVAIACWLGEESPERFLLGAVDSSMRGFVYRAIAPDRPGGDAWEGSVLDAATRNAIPIAALRVDCDDEPRWLAEARATIGAMLGYG